MDKRSAEKMARSITVQTHRDGAPAASRLTAAVQPLAAAVPDSHGWAVKVQTPSGQTYLVVEAGNLIRDLERAEAAFPTIARFAEYVLRGQ